MLSYMKETVEPVIGFFGLLGASNLTFTTGKVSLIANVATVLTLGRIVAWPTIAVNFDTNLTSSDSRFCSYWCMVRRSKNLNTSA